MTKKVSKLAVGLGFGDLSDASKSLAVFRITRY